LVLEQQTPVNLRDVSKHARFKYFPSINEEKLSSFLGVPLIEYRRPLGVLAIQNQENRLFTPEEQNLLITIASQISGLISKALLVDRIQKDSVQSEITRKRGDPIQLEGIPLAPGLAKDKVFILTRRSREEPVKEAKGGAIAEQRRLTAALAASEAEILELIEQVTSRVSAEEAQIFHAHLMFLEDRTFLKRVRDAVDDGASAAWAVWQVVNDYLKVFQNIDDPYLKERGADLEDVGHRLLNHLGHGQDDGQLLERTGILVSDVLSPSDTAQLDPKRIRGIVTSVGGYVSHAAILARSLRIPAVSGIENIVGILLDGEEALLDGQSGRVFVNPPATLVQEYGRYQETRVDYLSHLEDLRNVPAATKDGHRVVLRASVGLTQDLEDYRTSGAEGIGLFRTEVFYLMRSTRPTIDELAHAYENCVRVASPQLVCFRTLDLDGTTVPRYLEQPHEDNPYLGCRSIRFQMRRPDLLKDQLKAILRVAHLGPVRIMFPMVTHVQEIQELRAILAECRDEEQRESGRAVPLPQMGMMFEVPATVLQCDLFASEVDFFCIGSNDLTQYVLAVDRNNPLVSELYDPLDPAVLRLVRMLVDSAQQAHKPLGLVGEVASDPDGCLVLVGLGLRELSMNAPLVPILKDRLAQFTLAELEALAAASLECTSASAVRSNLQLRTQNARRVAG
jgi:phosphotransferase system enzyme I (PtsP)